LQLEKRTLEEKLADHENVLQSKITEINKLTEENEILSKKQMSNEETGASSNICNGVQNGEAEHEDTKLLSQKLSIANEEKEKVSQEKDSIVKQMTEEIEDYKNQLQSVSNELKTQKDKNDALRSKNWKAMDALNNVEQSYQKLLRAQTNSKQESTSTKTNSSLSVSVSFLFCVCPIISNVLLQVQFKSTQLLTNYFHCNCLNLDCDTLFFISSLPILVSLKNRL
jgi:uncharacterized protein YdiU (UPF0061 family)